MRTELSLWRLLYLCDGSAYRGIFEATAPPTAAMRTELSSWWLLYLCDGSAYRGIFEATPPATAAMRTELKNKSLKLLAPRVRFELTTDRLTADCSTTELPRNIQT